MTGGRAGGAAGQPKFQSGACTCPLNSLSFPRSFQEIGPNMQSLGQWRRAESGKPQGLCLKCKAILRPLTTGPLGGLQDNLQVHGLGHHVIPRGGFGWGSREAAGSLAQQSVPTSRDALLVRLA